MGTDPTPGDERGTTAAPAVARTRVAWVDVAKGLSILLVVLHHAVDSLAAEDWAPETLRQASVSLGTLRMPLFFLASGIFAARTLYGPWRRVLERRVLFFAWLYLVWCFVRYGWFGALDHGLDLEAWRSPLAVFRQLVRPASSLWFIYALAVFAVLARATRRVPAPVRIGAAAVLSALVGSGVVSPELYAWRVMAINLVFFVVGVDLSRGVRHAAAALAGPSAWAMAVSTGAGFVVLTLVLRQPGVTAVPGARLVTSTVALVAGVSFAVALADTRAGRVPQWLGSRTLEVYLMHGLVIGLLVKVATLAGLGPVRGMPGVVLTVAVAAVAAAASLAA